MKSIFAFLSLCTLLTLPSVAGDVKYLTVVISGSYQEQNTATAARTVPLNDKTLATAANIPAASLKKYVLVLDTTDFGVKFVAKKTTAGLPAPVTLCFLDTSTGIGVARTTGTITTVVGEDLITPASTPVSIFTANLKGFASSKARYVGSRYVSATGSFAGTSKDPTNAKDVIVRFSYVVGAPITQDND